MEERRQVHTGVSGFGSSPFVQTVLFNMYEKCENTWDAESLFDEIPDKNFVAWSAMISGYARDGMVYETLGLFKWQVLHPIGSQ